MAIPIYFNETEINFIRRVLNSLDCLNDKDEETCDSIIGKIGQE